METLKEKLKKISRKWEANEPAAPDPVIAAIDRVVGSALRWLMRNVVPVLLISLVIQVAILFYSPVELHEGPWSRAVSLLSVPAAYLIFRLFKSLYYSLDISRRPS